MNRPKPLPPSPEDCCGQGCNPCVNDIYDAELRLWETETAYEPYPKLNESRCEVNKSVFTSLNPDSYTAFKIKEILPVTDNTYIYRFELPLPNSCLLTNVVEIGQHLILRLVLNESKEEPNNKSTTIPGSFTRQYTVLSSPLTKGHFDIMIKLYENGLASRIIRRWTVGDFAEFRGPFGEFANKFMVPSTNQKLHLHDYCDVVMIAAGTGIAPMLQVIKFITDDEECDIRIHLLYSCQSTSQILLKNELKNFAGFWNFKLTYFITREENHGQSLVLKQSFHYAKLLKERIGKTFLENYIISKGLDLRSSKCLFLVCGTKSFEIEILDILKILAVPLPCTFKF